MAAVLPPKNINPTSNNFNAVGAILPPKDVNPVYTNAFSADGVPYMGADGKNVGPLGIDYTPTAVNSVCAVAGMVAGLWISQKNGYGIIGTLVAVAATAGMFYGIASAVNKK